MRRCLRVTLRGSANWVLGADMVTFLCEFPAYTPHGELYQCHNSLADIMLWAAGVVPGGGQEAGRLSQGSVFAER